MQNSSFMDSPRIMRLDESLCPDDVANFLKDYRTALFQIARTKRFPRAKSGSRAILSRVKVRHAKSERTKGKYILCEKKDLRANEMTFIILRGRGHRSTMFLLG